MMMMTTTTLVIFFTIKFRYGDADEMVIVFPTTKDRHRASSASAGQVLNQSIVQQLTSDGNLRSRLRNASPMGLIAKMTCNWLRHRCTNMLNSATGDPSVCLVLSRCRSSCRIFSHISARSSGGYKFGTSPLRVMTRTTNNRTRQQERAHLSLANKVAAFNFLNLTMNLGTMKLVCC